MRIRKRVIAVLLLMSALPHLLADDSSPLIPEEGAAVDDNDDDVDIGLRDQQQQDNRITKESIDDNQVDHDAHAKISPQTQEDEQSTKLGSISRPQQQEGARQNDDLLDSSRDHKEIRSDGDETKTTEEDYRSSLDIDNAYDEPIDIDTVDEENHDTDDHSENDEPRTAAVDLPGLLPEDGGESASQAIHEDGFRLPTLHKLHNLEINRDPASDVETENIDGTDEHLGDSRTTPEPKTLGTDISDHDFSGRREGYRSTESSISIEADERDTQTVQHDDIRLPELHFETDAQAEDSSMQESKTIEDADDDRSEEAEESQTIQLLEDTKIHEDDVVDEINFQHDYNERTKMTGGLDLDEVMIEEDNLSSFGSIGTPTTEELEDEEVVVLNSPKMAIGTTSIEPVVEDDIDSNDIEVVESNNLVVDTENIEEKDDGSEPQRILDNDPADSLGVGEIDGTTLENATKDVLVDEMTENITADTIGAVDKTDHSDDSDAKVEDLGEKDNIALITDTGEEVNDVDNRESSDDTDSIDNITEEENNQEIEDDDDEDEDLSDRVSVDYASKSAGALIIEKTAEFKGTSNLITGDRDRYAIVPCSEEKKQVVLSLSEGILVKEIKLANYERFSSTVRDFTVKGSHTLEKWDTLGTWKAKSGNGEQTFVLDIPTWARYLKFRFLTHHGAEYYCTLSQIKVHGSNMVQGFHEEWQTIEDENNEIQIEETQSENVSKTLAVEDSEKIDADEITEDTVGGFSTDKNSTSTLGAGEDDSELSKEESDDDANEKRNSGPKDAQATPSVRSKPKPFEDFRTPANFYEIIQGEIVDDKLFAELYDLIPNAMNNLPAHSKNDMCLAEEAEVRSVHQISRLAMESLYSFGTRLVDDIAYMVTDPNNISSSTIASPKMNEILNEYYQKKFGRGFSSMSNLNTKSLIEQPSTETRSSKNTITVGTNESSTRQTNETDEGNPDQRSKTADKSSPAPNKEESTLPAISESVDEANDSVDLVLLKLLKDLPSAECLVHLDFAEFKHKVSAARKSSGAAGGSPGGRMMEPIFKKLTDEIFALQTSLSVHDQFSKMSVGCYQRVILDLALETDKLRREQDERLRRLEEQILEPASMRMFLKFIAAVASTVTTWCVSNGLRLFATLKDDWLPRFLRFALSKDTYEGLRRAYDSAQVLSKNSLEGLQIGYSFAVKYSSQAKSIFQVMLHHFRRVIEILASALESSEWAKGETYQKFLSAWSAYYDGGMVVVVAVLTLIVCKLLMLCSTFRRRKKKKRFVRNTSKDPPALQSDTILSPHASNAFVDDRSTSAASSRKGKKRSRRKSKHKPSDPDQDVSIVEDIALQQPSEEPIPDLQDETPGESGTVSTIGMSESSATQIPPVVSLEEL